MHCKIRVACLIAIIIAVNIKSNQAQPINSNVKIEKLNGVISLDGKVDEAAWEAINPLPLTMHWPDYNGSITEATEIRIAYDDDFIYVGAICYDSDPSGIQATTFQRDAVSQKVDQVTILLDPYDDNENTLAFIITPTGSRSDIAFKNDAQGDDAVSVSWNSFWSGNSTINATGWQTELRIPFSSLRFQVIDDKVEMGMIVYRYVARKREMNTYPSIRPDWGFLSFAKASQAQSITFESIENKRPWYTSPYLLGGTGHHYEDNVIGEYEHVEDRDLQVGIDIQHALTDNLNADFTINTDFAQAEVDDQAVNLSRFSLFFPEKRRFFLERASTFDFKYDQNNNMFYSRRIGIEDGELIPLYGGIRIGGRINKWDIGLMNMQSQEKSEFATENFGVVRLRRNVINQSSYVGGMFTSRISADGNRNFAYGVDGIVNLFKQDYLNINIAQSNDSNDTTGLKGIDKARIYLKWESRIIKGFGYSFSYSNVGSDYNPGIGFENRFNYTQFGDKVFYSWFAPEKSLLRQTTVTVNGNVSFNNSTHELETYTMGMSSNWVWNRSSWLYVELENFYDNVLEDFDLSDDVTITTGEYSNINASINYSTPEVGLIVLGLGTGISNFYGGNLKSVSFSPEIIFSKYFNISGYYEFTSIDFDKLNQTFESHLSRLNMAASFNVKLSISAFAQFNSLDEISGINFRLRYNPIDGNDLYFVYNETINTNPMSVLPELPVSDNRSFILKYIHTFKL